VWETKEDQARKTKSRLERRLARKKEGMDIEGNKVYTEGKERKKI
jgi:hypothetical protein